ncbi:choline transporter-like protein 2 [Argopecten irradians]|uniref:choline transporter-like protein 2 n=1 Tax=Argopecten irradians TaxID=31199 RepID=UPI00371D3A0A
MAEEDESKKYGEARKHDPKFKGPLKNRSCTDIICCLLFLICIVAMIVCSAIGYARGNPAKLVFPTDSAGSICGYDKSVVSKPNLMYFDLLQCSKVQSIFLGCPTPQVCVESCTTDYYVYLESIAIETAGGGQDNTERNKLLCKYNVDPTSGTKTIQELVSDEDCAAYYLPNTAIVGRCVPSIFLTIFDKSKELVTSGNYNITTAGGTAVTGNLVEQASEYLATFLSATQVVELVFKDIVSAWYLMLIFMGIAMIFCFIWIVLLRWFAGILVWVSIIVVLALLGFGCYYSYSQYYDLKNQNVTAEFGVSELFTLNFSYYLGLKETWLAFGCTTATFLLIFLLVLIFLVSRICIAIELIKEGSRAIGNMIFTLFWPIIPFLMQVAVVAYMGASAIYIAGIGGPEYYSNGTDIANSINSVLDRVPCTPDNSTVGSFCDFVRYGGTDYIIAMEVFMLFMFFWLMNFVVALGQMTLAGAFASYYWAFEKPKDIPAFPLMSGLYRSIRYHLGTLAFGSLIIAIIQMIRVALEYLDSKLKGAENKVAKFMVKCLKCFFACLEKLIKFLNRNAYIMTAVYGKNFCTAAKDAFFLIMRNVVRAVVLDKVTDYVLFLSKLMVTAAIGVGAYFWFQGKVSLFTEFIPVLNYYLTPVIVVILGTYLITCCFFSVYTMAVDTLFLCFLEDLEMHDGSPEKPYYMSKGLMKILGKKNKKEKKVDKDEAKEEDK